MRRTFIPGRERTSSDRGVKGHDINSRIVYTMRTLGHGYTGMEKFTTLMNMPKPMTTHTYNNIVDKMVIAATGVAKESMSDTVTELKGIHSIPTSASVQTIDVGVSVDGTWQRRGFSSNNGVVTAISIDSGKVVDVEIMSKICKGCKQKEHLKTTDPLAYANWRNSHYCSFNYSGSAPGMEPEGAKRIFKRTMTKTYVMPNSLETVIVNVFLV